MTKQRTSLGFSDALDDFNPEEWAPKEKKSINNRNPSHKDTTLSASQISSQAADAAGFKSREAKILTSDIKGQGAQQRRRRTGRNAQFNLKARPETISTFCAIADEQDWGLGETLEKAVALLEREYQNHK